MFLIAFSVIHIIDNTIQANTTIFINTFDNTMRFV